MHIGDDVWRWGILIFSMLGAFIMMVEAFYLRDARGGLSLRVRFRNVGASIVLLAIVSYVSPDIGTSRPLAARDYFLCVGTFLVMVSMLLPRTDLPVHPNHRTWLQRVTRRRRERGSL